MIREEPGCHITVSPEPDLLASSIRLRGISSSTSETRAACASEALAFGSPLVYSSYPNRKSHDAMTTLHLMPIKAPQPAPVKTEVALRLACQEAYLRRERELKAHHDAVAVRRLLTVSFILLAILGVEVFFPGWQQRGEHLGRALHTRVAKLIAGHQSGG